MLKDLGLATDAAKQAKQSVAWARWRSSSTNCGAHSRRGAQDFSAIINLLKKPA
jgi:3-hydroxyisobutyrate dehydrogenase-like beta-hydroxyacid dehydrogenase